MRLIPLGTNGFLPSYGRQTACYLILLDGEAILLDAGTGASRLIEPEVVKHLDGVERLNVVISHYHLDHCVGLAYLSEAWPKEIVVYAPAPPFTKVGPEKALGTLLNAPYTPPLEYYPGPVKIVPVEVETLTIAGRESRFRAQKHWRGSMGIRIADDLTYVTDTVVDEGTVEFARGVRTLFHEIWMLDDEVARDETGRANHSNVSGVADIARRAGVERLIVIHHHPRRTVNDLVQIAQQAAEVSGVEVIVPVEGQVYEF